MFDPYQNASAYIHENDRGFAYECHEYSDIAFISINIGD